MDVLVVGPGFLICCHRLLLKYSVALHHVSLVGYTLS
jgi:hypothetical protein